MPNSAPSRACTDPIVGAILSGWRYDISSISPEMRTDYEQHLADCPQCRYRQRKARTIDVLLLSVSTLSIVAFLLAAVVLRRIQRFEIANHLQAFSSFQLHLHHTPITISLAVVAIAGAIISTVLWVLVAVATPIPGIISGAVQQRLPSDLRERILRRAA